MRKILRPSLSFQRPRSHSLREKSAMRLLQQIFSCISTLIFYLTIVSTAIEHLECQSSFGQGTPTLGDARAALARLPRSSLHKQYYFDRDDKPYHIPFRVTSGDVTIFVEAPPFANLVGPGFIRLTPNEIYEKAQYVIQHCLEQPEAGQRPNNGYIVWPWEPIRRYITIPNVDIARFPYPGWTAMVSVTVSTSTDWPKIAEYDIRIPERLALFEIEAALNRTDFATKSEYATRSYHWIYQVKHMCEAEIAGQKLTWYENLATSSEMSEVNRTISGNNTSLDGGLTVPANVS